MQRIWEFITFETPMLPANIQAQFARTHEGFVKQLPSWDYKATRQRMEAHYWYTNVLTHFFIVCLLPSILIGVFISKPYYHSFLKFATTVDVGIFLTLFFFVYILNFKYDFLPKLENITAGYELKQQQETINQLKQQLSEATQQQAAFQIIFQQQLEKHQKEMTDKQNEIAIQKLVIEQQKQDVKKCRGDQLPNFTLTLIYYAISKASGCSNLQISSQTGNMLKRLYGVDGGSLRECLKLIYGGIDPDKKEKRGETEYKNRFEEATDFLEKMGLTKSLDVLMRLEINFFA